MLMKLQWGKFDTALSNGKFDNRQDIFDFYDLVVHRTSVRPGTSSRSSALTVDVPHHVQIPDGLEGYFEEGLQQHRRVDGRLHRKERPKVIAKPTILHLPRELKKDVGVLQRRLDLPESDLELATKGTAALHEHIEPIVMPNDDKSLHATYTALCMAMSMLERGLYQDQCVVINGYKAAKGDDVQINTLLRVLPHVNHPRAIARYAAHENYLVMPGRDADTLDRLSALNLVVLGPALENRGLQPEDLAQVMGTTVGYVHRIVGRTLNTILNPAYERATKMLGLLQEYRDLIAADFDRKESA
jgi:hypothetical protein